MMKRWFMIPVVLCMVACSGDVVPVAPTDVAAPDLVAESPGGVQASGGNSGCYTVKFNVAASPSGPVTFLGVITGDLEGTLETEFDIGSVKYVGTTVGNAGIGRWEITGGMIPGLGTFQTTFNNRNHVIDRPGSPAWVYENTGRHRASEGVAKANLTYKGTFTGIPPGFVDHDYQGVICP